MPKNKQTTKKNTAGNAQPSATKPRKVYTFVPFIVFALALIVETCLIFSNGTGVTGKGIHTLLTGLFGGVAYLIPAGAITVAEQTAKREVTDRFSAHPFTSVNV